MSLLKMPYTNLHELNLDWIIEQLNKEGAVLSVNDKHGIVVLTAEDIGRTPNNPQTVEQALTSQGTSIQTVRTEIGVTPLPTTAQTITGAIAEHETDITGINTEIGTTPLPTTAQTLTGAIAENAGEIADIQDNIIGSTPLPTTAQTLTGAIAENAGEISDIQDNVIGSTPLPTTAQTLTGAIAEHETDINSISNKLNVTLIGISDFYDNRCSNIGPGEVTCILKSGNCYVCNINVSYQVSPSAAQTSILTLPAGIPAPSEQMWGVVYNRTTGKTHSVNVSTAGNVNILNRGEISTDDKVQGQVVWFAN